MSRPEFRRVHRADRHIPPAAINAPQEALEKVRDFYAPGGGLDFGVPGVPVRPRETMLATITAADGSAPVKYDWQRVGEPVTDAKSVSCAAWYDQITGGPTSPAGVRPAYEINSNANVPLGAVVELWPSQGGECLWFFWPTGADTGPQTIINNITYGGGPGPGPQTITFTSTGGAPPTFTGTLNLGGPTDPLTLNFLFGVMILAAGVSLNLFGPLQINCCIEWVPQIYTLTGTYNDWEPACAPLLYIETGTSSDVVITGMVKSCDWQVVTIKNVGTGSLVLTMGDTGSAAANRFNYPAWWNYDALSPGRIVLDPDESVVFWYDETVSGWNLLVLNAAMKPRGTDHSPGMVRDSGTSGANTDYWARDATWRAAPSGSTTGVNSEASNILGFSLTSGTYTNVLNLTTGALAAGTYLITARVWCSYTPAANGDSVSARLFDGTNMQDEEDPFQEAHGIDGGVFVGSVTMTKIYAAAASATVTVQCKRASTSAVTIKGRMTWVQIA